MSSSASSSTAAASTEAASEGAESTESGGRKRPKPGERRVQILQALATMLEQPGAERVTTAALAARLKIADFFRRTSVAHEMEEEEIVKLVRANSVLRLLLHLPIGSNWQQFG